MVMVVMVVMFFHCASILSHLFSYVLYFNSLVIE